MMRERGRSKALIAIAFLLLILPAFAAARVPHENFDEAELDLTIILNYLEGSLEALNSTLLSCLQGDLEGTLRASSDFHDLMASALGTLERIPDEVESKQYIELFLRELMDLDPALSALSSGFEGVMINKALVSERDFSVWTLNSLMDNLTKAGNGLSGLALSRSILSGAVIDIDEGLSSVEASGLNVTFQKLLADRLPEWLIDLTTDLPGTSGVLSEILDTPMSLWRTSLSLLVQGQAPSGNLTDASALLGIVLPFIGPSLSAPLLPLNDRLTQAGNGVDSFSSAQIEFLASFEALGTMSIEGPTTRTDDGIDSRVGSYLICKDRIKEMRTSILEQWSALQGLRTYDDGRVESCLEDLEALVDLYEEDLERVSLLDEDIERVLEAVNRTLRMNGIATDMDGSGSIDDDEIDNVALPSDLDVELVLLEQALKVLETDLSLMRSLGLLSHEVEVMANAVRRLSEGADAFSGHHQAFAEDLRSLWTELSSANWTYAPELYLSCLSSLEGMDGALRSCKDMEVALSANDFPTDLPFSELRALLELYEDLLERLGSYLNETMVILHLSPYVAPYDTIVNCTVRVFEKDPSGKTGWVSGRNVTLLMDGSILGNGTLASGRFQYRLDISRALQTGEHGVSCSYLDREGAVHNATRVLTVRPLRTLLSLDAGPIVRVLMDNGSVTRNVVDMDPGKLLEAVVTLQDELGRYLEANITVDGATFPIEGAMRFNRTYGTVGLYPLPAHYPGDRYHSNSTGTLLVLVRQDPIISLILRSRIFLMNETIDGTVVLTLGEGTMTVRTGAVSLGPWAQMTNENRSFSVNASVLGTGSFRAQAFLDSDSEWVRDGASQVFAFEVVLEDGHGQGNGSGNGSGDDDDGPDVPPDEEAQWGEDEDRWELPYPFDRWYVQWGLVLLVVTLLALVLLLIYLKRKKGSGPKAPKERMTLPEMYLPAREGTEGPEGPSGPPGTIIANKTVLRDREALIEEYLDMVESSPKDIGLRPALTPREVGSRLTEKGFDGPSSERLSDSFEASIYRDGDPRPEHVQTFRKEKGSVMEWFRTLF